MAFYIKIKMKRCKKCNELKPLSEFYYAKSTKDGHQGDCKNCQRNRLKIIYHAQHPFARTNTGISKTKEYSTITKRNHRKNNPEKELARRIAYRDRYNELQRQRYHKKNPNASYHKLKDKKLKKRPCTICGNINVEAHHDDYSKPLEIKWLCRRHHLQIHGYVGGDNEMVST